MPIEIKELIVRATITAANKQKGGEKHISSEGKSNDRNMIIQECVDQVMQILKDKNER